MLRRQLLREDVTVGRRHIATLMKQMRIAALAPGHRIYPYLLRDVAVVG